MLDKKHIVDVPKGAIVKSDRVVLWTIRKNYIQKKKYNQDQRRMIGKTLDDDQTRMYPNDNFKELFPDVYNLSIGSRPKPSFQIIGYYVAMKEIAKALPLYKTLCDVFGKEDTDLILDYATYQIAFESSVAQDFESGMKDKALFSEKLRSDSYLSDFFKNSLSEDKIDLFYEQWATAIIRHKKLRKVYLNVDGSNVDCEAEGVTLAEKGHDKSGQKTTIVNMMYAVAPDGTPVTCHQYRGSVIDQTAVKYLIKFFSHTGVSIAGFCADRGFCSKANADMLRENGMGFVLMMTSKPDGFSDARDRLRDGIRNNVDKWIDGTELFGDTTKVRMFSGDEEESFLHVYYDSNRAGCGITKILRRINKAKKDAVNAIGEKKTPVFPKDVAAFIGLRKGTGPKTVEIYKDRIQEAIDNSGFHVLATSEQMTALEACNIYRARDSSEKQYMVMKSKLGLDVYRAGSDKSIGGRQFVAFVAGILRNEIHLSCNRMLEETGHKTRYTTQEVLKELNTIRIKRLPGDEYALVMDLSARDEFTLKHLGISKSKLEEYAAKQNDRIHGRIKKK